MLEEVPASILRDELVRLVAGRLELTEARLSTLLAAGAGASRSTSRGADDGGTSNGVDGRRSDSGPRPERLFLALCIALPEHGAETLAAIDPEQLLTSEQLRRAARHLAAGHTGSPLADLPVDDEEFARLMAGLVELAGRIPGPSGDRLEYARLVLDRGRLDRAIIRARGHSHDGPAYRRAGTRARAGRPGDPGRGGAARAGRLTPTPGAERVLLRNGAHRPPCAPRLEAYYSPADPSW